MEERIKIVRMFVATRGDTRLRGAESGKVLRVVTKGVFLDEISQPLYVLMVGHMVEQEFWTDGYVIVTEEDFDELLRLRVLQEVSAEATLHLLDIIEKAMHS